jgi:hypothetical protein
MLIALVQQLPANLMKLALALALEQQLDGQPLRLVQK